MLLSQPVFLLCVDDVAATMGGTGHRRATDDTWCVCSITTTSTANSPAHGQAALRCGGLRYVSGKNAPTATPHHTLLAARCCQGPGCQAKKGGAKSWRAYMHLRPTLNAASAWADERTDTPPHQVIVMQHTHMQRSPPPCMQLARRERLQLPLRSSSAAAASSCTPAPPQTAA